MSSDAEDRFSDAEVSVILNRAADETTGVEPRRPPESGMSLAQLQDIAREAGIEPRAVARAARSVQRERVEVEPFLDNTTRTVLTLDLPVLDADGMAKLVDTTRDVLGNTGTLQAGVNGVEWHTVGDVSQVHLSIAPTDDQTVVRIRADRNGAAILTAFLSVASWLGVGAVTGAIVEPGLVGGIGLMLGAAGGGLATALAVWKRNTGVVRTRLQRLVHRLRSTVGTDARPTD